MNNEFYCNSKQRKFLIIFIFEFKFFIKSFLRKVMFFKTQSSCKEEFKLRNRYSITKVKRLIISEGISIVENKKVSWFYTALTKKKVDVLTRFALTYIEKNFSKNSNILVTGCGTGIMAFHLAELNFKKISGSDFLPGCINVAKKIKEEYHYKNTNFFIEDSLNPSSEKKYDVITALHWVFSALGGNYGNPKYDKPFALEYRNEILNKLLSVFSRRLNEGGYLFIELTDAVADYREPYDHPFGEESRFIYPIRFTPKQLTNVGKMNSLEVIEKRLSIEGHHPRTSYVLKKVNYSL